MPLISEVELKELNKLRRPLVMPHMDELGWLVGWLRRERKLTSEKLFQFLKPVKKCDLLICYREEIQGILNYLTVWKPNWVASKDLLWRMGWSMLATSMMGTNPMEIPNKHCS